MSEPKVYLVGAGPGDESLITLRAIELLKQADCVIYDGLVNTALLKYAPEHAELISVRKRTGPKPASQEMIAKLLIEKAKQGKTVIRLKGGDPGMFGRVPEEAAVCAKAKIPFEIVPGITAGLAAAEYTGIFLSDRDYSSQVLFVTGHEAAGKKQSNIDFKMLANFKGSIVFYMAMTNLVDIATQLIRLGKDKNTPVAVIQNATLPTQKFLKSILENVTQDCIRQNITPPAIVIIGTTADSNEAYNWFAKRPLFGKNILITRDSKGNNDFAQKLLSLGANPVRFDSIEIQDLTQHPNVQNVLKNLDSFDWIIFTSANGVRFTFNALQKIKKDARAFAKANIACIGPKTSEALVSFRIIADFIPDIFTGVELAKQLAASTDLKNKKILLLRSQIASPELPESLTKAGARVQDVAVYTVKTSSAENEELTEQIKAGAIDFLTFTSPSTVQAFLERIDSLLIKSAKIKIASIGPVTTIKLKETGLTVRIEAKIHTIDGLITAIKENL
jgi:uroporphyrinogen III methyltransferase/synthase